MEAEFIADGSVVQVSADPTVYRARIWGPPPAPGFAWFVDEWELRDVTDVTEAVAWASSRADGNPFELFVESYQILRNAATGESARAKVHTRIYGAPAEEEVTSEKVMFWVEGEQGPPE